MRKPFQGIWNIIRFNRHFYILFLISVFILLLLFFLSGTSYKLYFLIAALIVSLPVLMSLLISLYVYDLSGFYSLDWVPEFMSNRSSAIATFNAGFDETSSLIQKKFPDATLKVFDFYDPEKHTEISIKRARRAYPAFPGTVSIKTSLIPLDENSIDASILIFAAHEIRNTDERILFFGELRRILKPGGKVIVVEHLRDASNFMAYTIGFFHFLPKKTWLHTFDASDLKLASSKKINPFVTLFILERND